MSGAAPVSRGLLAALGPGVLFAGAAVGVSHLVQSTRAGADYGLALAGVVVLANVLKYPAFRFGPLYAAATGTSLLEGYRRQGRWALGLYALLTVGTMFTVAAAVTLVTAGIAKHVFALSASVPVISAVVLGLCALTVALGRYHWLDRVGKAVMAVLGVTTLVAFAAALPELDLEAVRLVPDLSTFGPADVAFVAALVGWMPSAVDVSVWQSLWTLARGRDSGHRPTLRESMADFHVGYVGTAVLALCFLVLGAAVMHGEGVPLDGRPAVFAAQVIDLYAASLGAWSRPLVATCALLTMLSTTLTVVDGFPRAITVLLARFARPEEPGGAGDDQRRSPRAYWLAALVLVAGALAILFALATPARGVHLEALVDLATILSFLSAPILAWLNHRAVLGTEVPAAARPGLALAWASRAGIAGLGAFALYYLYLLATT